MNMKYKTVAIAQPMQMNNMANADIKLLNGM
jgi:hypothetical protein